MCTTATSPPPSPARSTSSDTEFADFLEDKLCESEDECEIIEPDLERIKRRKLNEVTCKPDVNSTKDNDECEHPGVFGSMCFKCGKHIEDDDSGVKLSYIHKGLKLYDAEITRVRNKDRESLIRHKKLYLVLDLDHTLLNTTNIRSMSLDENYIKAAAHPFQGSLFPLPSHNGLLTKLRPFVHTLLKEASKMYEMYIYTMGDHHYAHEIVKLLDPRKEYFNWKVITRDESTQKHLKGLDVLLGQENVVVILDDTESVWPDHKDNLILIEKYHFFASSLRSAGIKGVKSLCELKSDDSEAEGALANALDFLRQIHNTFYDCTVSDLVRRDVRQVRRSVVSSYLQNTSTKRRMMQYKHTPT